MLSHFYKLLLPIYDLGNYVNYAIAASIATAITTATSAVATIVAAADAAAVVLIEN